MTQELTEMILKNRETYRAFETLKHCDQSVFDVMNRKLLALSDYIAEAAGLINTSEPIARHRKYGGLSFSKDTWNNHDLCIGIQFMGTYYNDLYFGVAYTKPKDDDAKNRLAQLVNSKFRDALGNANPPNAWWPANFHYSKDNWRYWTEETYEDILFSNPSNSILGEYGEDLLNKIKTMTTIVDESLSEQKHPET